MTMQAHRSTRLAAGPPRMYPARMPARACAPAAPCPGAASTAPKLAFGPTTEPAPAVSLPPRPRPGRGPCPRPSPWPHTMPLPRFTAFAGQSVSFCSLCAVTFVESFAKPAFPGSQVRKSCKPWQHLIGRRATQAARKPPGRVRPTASYARGEADVFPLDSREGRPARRRRADIRHTGRVGRTAATWAPDRSAPRSCVRAHPGRARAGPVGPAPAGRSRRPRRPRSRPPAPWRVGCASSTTLTAVPPETRRSLP